MLMFFFKENWNKVNELKRALTQNNENNKLLNQEINNLENGSLISLFSKIF